MAENSNIDLWSSKNLRESVLDEVLLVEEATFPVSQLLEEIDKSFKATLVLRGTGGILTTTDSLIIASPTALIPSSNLALLNNSGSDINIDHLRVGGLFKIRVDANIDIAGGSDSTITLTLKKVVSAVESTVATAIIGINANISFVSAILGTRDIAPMYRLYAKVGLGTGNFTNTNYEISYDYETQPLLVNFSKKKVKKEAKNG